MATQLNEYYEFLKTAKVEFIARPYYEPESDSLIFYARDDQSYAKRINSLLTLYLSSNDDSLVGCEIKGVKRMLRICGDFGVLVRDEKIKLGFLLAFALDQPPDHPALDEYAEKVRQFESVDVDQSELVPA
jgi:hypothetical protein